MKNLKYLFYAVLVILVTVVLLIGTKSLSNQNTLKSNSAYEEFSSELSTEKFSSTLSSEEIVVDNDRDADNSVKETTIVDYTQSDAKEEVVETKVEELEVVLSEDAAGFNKEALIDNTIKYCKDNNITGRIIIVDANYLDNNKFSCDIDVNGEIHTFNFTIGD